MVRPLSHGKSSREELDTSRLRGALGMPRDDDAPMVTVGSTEVGTATVRSATVRSATVRYWAGARAAAGVETDLVRDCATIAEAVAAVDALHPGLAPVTAVSTLLLDGR